MTGAITWDQIAFILGIIAAIGALWYRVETRISKNAVTALERANAAHENLHNFRLEVAENYAKGDLIKDVETRVLSRIDAVVAELHGMRKDFQDAMMKMAMSNQKRQE